MSYLAWKILRRLPRPAILAMLLLMLTAIARA
jgi:hypothetical protein